MRLPCMPDCGLVVSTPSMMKRFSPAVAPSIVMPFDLASKLAPGACVTIGAEVTALRQLHELVGRDAVGALAALDVDERLFGRDLDAFRQTGHAQRDVEHLGLAERSSTRENVFGVKPESLAVTS